MSCSAGRRAPDAAPDHLQWWGEEFPATLANTPGLTALILCFTLHAAGCAHAPSGPAAPRIAIAVANIGFGPDNGLTPEEQAKCAMARYRATQKLN